MLHGELDRVRPISSQNRCPNLPLWGKLGQSLIPIQNMCNVNYEVSLDKFLTNDSLWHTSAMVTTMYHIPPNTVARIKNNKHMIESLDSSSSIPISSNLYKPCYCPNSPLHNGSNRSKLGQFDLATPWLGLFNFDLTNHLFTELLLLLRR